MNRASLLPSKTLCSGRALADNTSLSGTSSMSSRRRKDLTCVMFDLCNNGRLKLAVDSLFSMGYGGTYPSLLVNYAIYVRLLEECTRLGALRHGLRVHAHMSISGFRTDVVVLNMLLNMYVKCGCISGAHNLFVEMPIRDVVSWTTMISGFITAGLHTDAFLCFKDMLHTEILANEFTFTVVLRACSTSFLVREATQVHAMVIKVGMPSFLCVSNVLILLYVRFQDSQFAHQVFMEMPRRDVISWNCLMSANVDGIDVMSLYKLMLENGLKPTDVTFVNLLRIPLFLIMIQQIHSQVMHHGLMGYACVGSSLINEYANAGRLEDARQVFDDMPVRDMIVWTMMINKYAENDYPLMAVDLFSRMQGEELSIDHIVVATILGSCCWADCLEGGKQIHCFIIKIGFETVTFVRNSLLSMYSKCERISEAQKVFSEISAPDAVSFNALICSHAQVGNHEEAIGLFCMMHQQAAGCNHISLTGALGAACQVVNVHLARGYLLGAHIHGFAVKFGYDQNLFVGNSLVTMYVHNGSLASAEKVFESIAFKRDPVSWTAMMTGYEKFGMDEEALQLFQRMHQVCVCTTSLTFSVVLGSAANLASLHQGKQIAALIEKSGFLSNISIRNSMLTMYAKCGRISDAFVTFKNTRNRDRVTWNAIITRLAQHGQGKDALDLFAEMQSSDIKPDMVTFIGVLSACSHAGLVEEGRRFFESMHRDHNINPSLEHYACIVDLYGRGGHLDEAVTFIQDMPIPPSSLQWRILLSACKKHRNSKLGKLAAEKLMELDPLDASCYTLLSNIYAYEERWEEMANLRKIMKSKSLTLHSGCSWIEVKGKIHIFQCEDRSHPHMLEVYEKLDELIKLIEIKGYIKDLSCDSHNVVEEHKHTNLSSHSEKLAVAYAVLNMAPGAPIIIMKNLRICSDCHTAAKLFSEVIEREIIIRDRYRFHHFRNGLCSCKDYW